MDRHQHDLVVRHVTDDFHDVLGILRAEAAGGFIEKEDVRRADHIEADIQPLAFAAAEDFLFGRADDGGAAFVEAELGEFAVDAAEALPAA